MFAKRPLLVTATLCAVSLGLSQQALAGEPLDSLCQHKAHEIQQQLEIAEQEQNRGQIAGLTRALQGVQQNCSNEQLLNDDAQEVREHTAEVREREAELSEAERSGDAEDVRKRTAKLEEAVEELDASRQALQALEAAQ
ncbi:MAG: DUF1090 domain-containing protein [Pseudomonas sp.]|uniref:DUF1090 domain-containing protein n=1 Tax=Pseudomonas sp. TaxID=306 RepID=UPI003241D336